MIMREIETLEKLPNGKRKQLRRVKSEIRSGLPELLERPEDVLEEVKCAFFGCEATPMQAMMLAKWFEVRSHFLQSADAQQLRIEKEKFEGELKVNNLNRSSEMVRAITFITDCFTKAT